VSILLTHSTLKSLHSAQLSDGSTLLDNKEADALMKNSRSQLPPLPGPLLLWSDVRVQSISTVIFYAQRPVQEVQLAAPAPGTPLDRYMFNPMTLDAAVRSEPRLLLLDKALISQIPSVYTYTPLQSATDIELGTIVRTR